MTFENPRLGTEYLHSENRRYQIDDIGDYDVVSAEEGDIGAILDATGYETTHTVGWVLLNEPTGGENTRSMVIYTQLDEGSYPEGTQWTRESSDFQNNFTEIIK